MAKLPKFTLAHNEKMHNWQLENDQTDKVLKSFKTKAEATAGGVLEKAVGREGGSVKIQKIGGKYQEERTYPGSKDPPKSVG